MRRAIAVAVALAAGALTSPAAALAFPAVEGQALPASTFVGTFVDGVVPILGNCTPSTTYAATISWGDGSSSLGAVTGPINPVILGPCTYAVSGGHTYADEAAAPLPVTTSVSGGGNPPVTPNLATVADAPLSAQSAAPVAATLGTPLSGALATFTDANAAAAASDFTATVNWGDGSTATAATVAPAGAPGVFAVSGSHVYAQAGSFHLSISIGDDGGSTSAATNTATVSAAGGGGPRPLALSLAPIRVLRHAMLAIGVSCPPTARACRGRLVAYQILAQTSRQLGTSLFILAGGASATLDIRLARATAAALRRAGSVRIGVAAAAFDPAGGSAGGASEVGTVNFGAAGGARHARRRAH